MQRRSSIHVSFHTDEQMTSGLVLRTLLLAVGACIFAYIYIHGGSFTRARHVVGSLRGDKEYAVYGLSYNYMSLADCEASKRVHVARGGMVITSTHNKIKNKKKPS